MNIRCCSLRNELCCFKKHMNFYLELEYLETKSIQFLPREPPFPLWNYSCLFWIKIWHLQQTCKFTKCEQLCISNNWDPTPNCRSFSETILLSWYFINLHHVCQAWHVWQWGQCGLLLFESTDNACFTVLQMSTLNKTFDKTSLGVFGDVCIDWLWCAECDTAPGGCWLQNFKTCMIQ